jgi:hypothetical protein
MKTRISMAMRSLWIVALLFVAQSANAQGFEGRIVQSIEIPALGGDKMEMVMNVKGDKIMMDMDAGPAGAMSMYPKSDGSSMLIVMKAMKMGMEVNMDAANKLAQTTAAEAQPEMKATGKKETINGYAAEEWTVSMEENTTMTMWLTSDIDKGLAVAMQTAMKAMNSRNPSASQNAVAKKLAEKGMVAVRSTVAKDGDTMAVIDLVKIEKTSIPDATFTPPTDITIQKMDPNAMPQGN